MTVASPASMRATISCPASGNAVRNTSLYSTIAGTPFTVMPGTMNSTSGVQISVNVARSLVSSA
jgi:hypothetical protein